MSNCNIEGCLHCLHYTNNSRKGDLQNIYNIKSRYNTELQEKMQVPWEWSGVGGARGGGTT